MNVIVSLFVTQFSIDENEIILAEQRIGEITALNGSIWNRKNLMSDRGSGTDIDCD